MALASRTLIEHLLRSLLDQGISQSQESPMHAEQSIGDTSRSPLDECEQVGVDLVLFGGGHAMRRARVDLQRRILDDLGRKLGRRSDRYDLVVITVQKEC